LRQGPHNSLHVRIAPNVLHHRSIDRAAQKQFKMGNETIFAQDDFEMLALLEAQLAQPAFHKEQVCTCG